MDNYSERLLAAVSRFIEGTDFVNTVANALIPKKAAKAACWPTGWYCYRSECGTYCGSKNFPGYKVCYYWEKHWYDPYDYNCEASHLRTCTDKCQEGCWETVPLGSLCPA